MKLGLLAGEAGFDIPADLVSLDITRTTDDSRLAGPGTLFFATKEGRPFASDAARAGAIVAGPGDSGLPGALVCPDPAASMAIVAACLFGHPSRKLTIVGITGTNGKTSTAWMIYHLWKQALIPSAMIGTLGLRYAASPGQEDEVVEKTGYTTPRSWMLQEMFHRLYSAGVKRVVTEVSSEALDLGRLAATDFHTAVFTNLTRDHLDFHGSMENYFAAKKKLLSMTAERGGRIICFAGRAGGAAESAELRMDDFALELAGQTDAVVTIVQEAEDLGRPAHFQNINATLAVLAAAIRPGEEAAFRAAAKNLPEVPGRFESVDLSAIAPAGSIAVVDYAHSPDALLTLLLEARGRFARVCSIFGCGGNRDPGKRPIMGRIAFEHSDRVIVTDDNPRREDPAAIRREIMEGMREAGFSGKAAGKSEVLEMADRRAAIEEGLRWAALETVPAIVIVAGKGHEEGQIFADRTEGFSDLAEVKSALARRTGSAG
jgi:UDP-N-acetylmuramoyl-L-alanyl-D-glutamate--2,6-diaminopimelate ligase